MIDLRSLFTSDIPAGDTPLKIQCDLHPDKTASRCIYPTHSYCFSGRCSKPYMTYKQVYKQVTGKEYEGELTFDNYEPTSPVTTVPTSEMDIPSHLITGSFSMDEVNLSHRLLLTTYMERMEWLFNRKFTPQTIIDYKLGHSGISFTIPIWDRNSKNVLTLRHRNDDVLNPKQDGKKYRKYWGTKHNNTSYLVESWRIGLDETVVLCESELDAILLNQFRTDNHTDFSGISLTNGINSYVPKSFIPYLPLLYKIKHLVVAVDRDPASKDRAEEIGKWFDSISINTSVAVWDHSDGKDVGDIIKNFGIGEFRKIVEGSINVKDIS